jgi:hypothetical protein
MNYKFKPLNPITETIGVVKKVDSGTHYSTFISPFDFEIDESKDMYVCGTEYSINESKAEELFLSGYAQFLNPAFIQNIEIIEE